MNRWRRVWWALSLAVIGLLAGCGAGQGQDIEAWIASQRARLSPRVEVLPQPRPFEPEPYALVATLDPFNGQRLAQALAREDPQAQINAALVAPELRRRQEALEAFPLDTMVMVGTLARQGRRLALLQIDNRLYTVAPGQYLGQNYGRVLRITPSEVHLREVVRDPAGTWVERHTTLKLQEKAR